MTVRNPETDLGFLRISVRTERSSIRFESGSSVPVIVKALNTSDSRRKVRILLGVSFDRLADRPFLVSVPFDLPTRGWEERRVECSGALFGVGRAYWQAFDTGDFGLYEGLTDGQLYDMAMKRPDARVVPLCNFEVFDPDEEGERISKESERIKIEIERERREMKRWLIAVIVTAVAGAGGYLGFVYLVLHG